MKMLSIVVFTLSIPAAIFAMEKPSIYISSRQILYIGTSPARNRLEKIYGTKFSLDTVFVNIGFQNMPQRELPQFIPFDFIKDCEEGSQLTLQVNGEAIAMRCAQKNSPVAPQDTFHKAKEDLCTKFRNRPDWADEGKESLVAAGVIKENKDDDWI